MKLKINEGNAQPDPFMCEVDGGWAMYTTGKRGVEAYSSDSPFSDWKYEGTILTLPGYKEFWAPCMIRLDGWYYLYFSCASVEEWEIKTDPECLFVARAKTPFGPFTDVKRLYSCFSIDPHVVQTDAGLFLWYSMNRTEDTERVGTRVYVEKLLDPFTPDGHPVEVISPTMDEEIFVKDRFKPGEDWHTIEGAFWLEHEGWQYVMYSGACYQNDTYHIGYAAAKTDEMDLTKVVYTKHTRAGAFDPLMIKDTTEEGVGHNSVFFYNGFYYVVYHGRDCGVGQTTEFEDKRTARICKLLMHDGVMKVEKEL